MNRKHRVHTRQKQLTLLQTNTRERQTRRQVMQHWMWGLLIVGGLVLVGLGAMAGTSVLLDVVLYTNPQYSLTEIQIEPRGHFSEHTIRQAAGLEPGQNLWKLNLPTIAQDLEKLPYVASARIERKMPNRVVIHIHERVPVVKLVALNADLGIRETYFLDKDCIVLKPRGDEDAHTLPEIIGLTGAEVEPGKKLDRPRLVSALQILDAIDHTSLHTLIDIRTINLKDPLYLTMVTTQDLTITFRPDCIDQQLVRLSQIFSSAYNWQRTLHTIDLTPDYNVPVTFNP